MPGGIVRRTKIAMGNVPSGSNQALNRAGKSGIPSDFRH